MNSQKEDLESAENTLYDIINEKDNVMKNRRFENRKIGHTLKIEDDTYKVFPVYYPVGNGIFNIDKSKEDIRWIISNLKK